MKFINATILFLFLASATAAYPCSNASESKKSETSDLSWIKYDTPIYGLDEHGLYKAHLNSPDHEMLLKVKQKFKRGMHLSPDGKYIFYSVSTTNDYKTPVSYFLYDIGSAHTRPIQNVPKITGIGDLEFLGFSPDSNFLLGRIIAIHQLS